MIHVAARTLATHALSIFGDHSDVMAARHDRLRDALLRSVQEAQDFALVAHAATLESRVPFLHFFDGFRTSHEVAKIEALDDDDLRAMIDDELVRAHRAARSSPTIPCCAASAQNPDVFFQAREACNPLLRGGARHRAGARWTASPPAPAAATGCSTTSGRPRPSASIVLMGSGAGAARRRSSASSRAARRSALVKVRLFRPFSAAAFVAALPRRSRDRGARPHQGAGRTGEPLYQDVLGLRVAHVIELPVRPTGQSGEAIHPS